MTKTTRALLLIAIAGLVSWPGVAPTSAQTEPSRQWTDMGRLPAPVYGLAQEPGNTSTMYVLANEGISRSTDGGATWNLCNRDARSMKFAAPTGDDHAPAVLYAGGPSGLRGSTDHCATWTDVPAQGLLPSSANVRWLTAYPDNRAILYASMDGLGGLYRSTDSGSTWHPASKGLPPGAWVTSLTADRLHPEHVLVGLRYATDRHPPAYVYASADGGLTWRSRSLGLHLLPNNRGEIVGLAWSGDTVFAATASDGLYASTDRGESWQHATLPRRTEGPSAVLLPGAPASAPMPLAIRSLWSTAEGALLVSTAEGVFRSLDGAQTWQGFGPASAMQGDVTLSLDPDTGRVLLSRAGRLWAYNMPSGVVAVKTPTAPAVAEVPPTPPPPPATTTRVPATPTVPLPTPTAQIAARPPGWVPSDPAQPLDPSLSSYFAETKHNVKYGFRDYWVNNGGLALLGYPLTEEFNENGGTVQYFERARLEYRDNKIVWGLLGTELTQGRFFQTVRFFPSEDNNAYFGPTQHSVSGPFLAFWRDNGGLETLGYPISESYKEDGSEYQWFERARLEWHPDLPEGKRIVLGQLGREALQKRGWIK